MLEFYIESDLKLRHVRQCPVGEHLDRFAGWLHAVGYKRRPAQLTLRGAAHLGYWASQHGVPIERFDEEVIDAFSRHLCTCVCAHAFEGRDHYHSCGARRPPISARSSTRPALATERLSLTRRGNVRYRLKTPYRDGTTHVVFEPLDFIARLAALVPTPRVNLTRFHGVFAPNHNLRAQVTPARRGPRRRPGATRCVAERHAAMTWAQRLKRVFQIDIDTCTRCGGAVRIIASIERLHRH